MGLSPIGVPRVWTYILGELNSGALRMEGYSSFNLLLRQMFKKKNIWSHGLGCWWDAVFVWDSGFLDRWPSQITVYLKKASLLDCIHKSSSRVIAEGCSGQFWQLIFILVLTEHSQMEELFKWKSSFYFLISWQSFWIVNNRHVGINYTLWW